LSTGFGKSVGSARNSLSQLSRAQQRQSGMPTGASAQVFGKQAEMPLTSTTTQQQDKNTKLKNKSLKYHLKSK
jgi:hypothetical protein